MAVLVITILASVSLFAADGSLEKVKKDGYFTVGLDATFAPMGFRDENEEIVGFDIDLAKEVAKRMGVEAKFKPCEWDGIIFDPLAYQRALRRACRSRLCALRPLWRRAQATGLLTIPWGGCELLLR